jgi:hypothetical protein
MTLSSEMIAPDLPPYSLDVQPMELGDDTKAIGLELLETESREPLRGAVASQIWSAAFPVLAAKESLAVDFFSHLERVREFCKLHWCWRNLPRNSCVWCSSVLKKRFSGFEWAPRQSRKMRSWKMNCRIAVSMRIRRPILVIHFAPCASLKTLG